MTDPLSQFREALSVAGVSCDAPIVPDGKIHRYRATEDKAANSWYVLFQENGFAAGSFGCWKRNFSQKWSAKREHALTPEQNASMRKHWREAEAVREAEERKRHAEAALNARDLIAEGGPVEEHPYLEKKKVRPYGDMVLNYSELILPLRDASGNLHSAQRIDEAGEKRFLFGGRVDGCFYTLIWKATGPIVICEGFATGASIAEATGFSTVAAMNCGNLRPVYESLRALHPSRFIILAADDDRWTSGNPGRTKAKEIVDSANDPLLGTCHPVFSDSSSKPTDFNDLANLEGLDRVSARLRAAFPFNARSIGDFVTPPDNDPDELIKRRFLCRRGLLLIFAPSGIGKSSFLMQQAICFALNRDFFGIRPTAYMKTVFLQAENDDGDIAEIRDGICSEMNLSEADLLRVYANVIIVCTAGERGQSFAALADSVLDSEKPDFLVIDPALAYIQGDIKDSTDVGIFLRNQIIPTLAKHNCGGILCHHTNKPPTGKEKPNWAADELMYLGSGSSEFTNAARAVMSIQSTGEHGIYRLTAAKRGARIGWREPHNSDVPAFSILIGYTHMDSKSIHWSQMSESDLPDPDNPKPSPHSSRSSKYSWNSFLQCSTWNLQPMPKTEFLSLIQSSFNIKRQNDYRLYRCLDAWFGRHISLHPDDTIHHLPH